MPKRGRNRKVEVKLVYDAGDLEDFYSCDDCPGRDRPITCARMMKEDSTPIRIPGVGCGRDPEEE